MGKTTGSQSFIKNFFVLGFGSFIYLIIGLIGTPVITRLVDPAEYGYMSMFTVYSNIGLMFCGLGLDQTLVRYFYHRDDLDYKRTILFECMSTPMILCVVLGLLILPAALFTNTMGWCWTIIRRTGRRSWCCWRSTFLFWWYIATLSFYCVFGIIQNSIQRSISFRKRPILSLRSLWSCG